jgi:galactonate dehydratase
MELSAPGFVGVKSVVLLHSQRATLPLITRIRSHSFNVSDKTNWFFICVETDDGARGWGEASLNGWEPLLEASTGLRAAELTGLDLQDAAARVRPAPQSPGGLISNAVASALQQAIADVQAQGQGVPLHALLGKPKRLNVPVYANINRATTDRRPAGFAATAARARESGFRAFKAAPFDGVTPVNCATPQGQALIRHGVDCLFALRDEVGPDALVMVDCHWRFDEARAMDVLNALAPARLHWFECPLAETHANWPALRRIRAAAKTQGVLLAAAETQVGLASFEMLFAQELYDVVMPDVKYCGGPREMLRIAERASACGVVFSPHNPTGPVCTLASLHVAAAAPQCGMLELQFAESPFYDALVSHRHPLLEEGGFTVPRTPGLGAALDEALLAAHPYQKVGFGIETLMAG